MKKQVVCLVGGAGFIGSITAHYLISKGYEVIVIDNLSTGRISNVPEKARLYKLDMNSLLIPSILSKHDVDVIVLLAADISVIDGENDALSMYENNCKQLFELLNNLPSKFSIVHISSAAVYGHQEGNRSSPYDSELRPINNYGMTKDLNELFLEKAPFNTINLRVFNVYGTMYGIKKRIKGAIELLETAEEFTMNGDGSSDRDYVHVLDVAQAIELSIQRLRDKTTSPGYRCLNVGTGQGTTLKWLVDYYKEKRPELKIKHKKEKGYDIKHSVADISFTKFYLGYKPTIFFNKNNKKIKKKI